MAKTNIVRLPKRRPNHVPQRDYKKVTGYRWIDKDPAIDTFFTVQEKLGWSDSKIERAGGSCSSTLQAWRTGKTRRPLNSTLSINYRIMGVKNYLELPDGSQVRVPGYPMPKK